MLALARCGRGAAARRARRPPARCRCGSRSTRRSRSVGRRRSRSARTARRSRRRCSPGRRPIASGPVAPFADDDATISSGAVGQEARGVEAEPGHHAGAEVVDDDVGPVGEPVGEREALGLGEVDLERPLVEVELVEVRRAVDAAVVGEEAAPRRDRGGGVDSTFTTSAPRRASRHVAYGPAAAHVKSRIADAFEPAARREPWACARRACPEARGASRAPGAGRSRRASPRSGTAARVRAIRPPRPSSTSRKNSRCASCSDASRSAGARTRRPGSRGARGCARRRPCPAARTTRWSAAAASSRCRSARAAAVAIRGSASSPASGDAAERVPLLRGHADELHPSVAALHHAHDAVAAAFAPQRRRRRC